MKVLAIGRPRPDVDVARELPRLAEPELRAVWTLYRDGVLREMYSPGAPGAVLVFEVGAERDARRLLDALPMVTAGVIEFEVIGLHPFSALDMLFAPTGEGDSAEPE
jgi:hypothetical protein